jgi:hypothetical protein
MAAVGAGIRRARAFARVAELRDLRGAERLRFLAGMIIAWNGEAEG